MEIFGISIWELLIILVVVLIVLGPNRLPGIARSLGKAVRTIKQASNSFTTAITKEMESSPDGKSAAAKKDTSDTKTEPEDEKTPLKLGNLSALEKQNSSEKPEGQPPQDEQ